MRLTSPFAAAEVLSASPISHLGSFVILLLIKEHHGLALPPDNEECQDLVDFSYNTLLWT